MQIIAATRLHKNFHRLEKNQKQGIKNKPLYLNRSITKSGAFPYYLLLTTYFLLFLFLFVSQSLSLPLSPSQSLSLFYPMLCQPKF